MEIIIGQGRLDEEHDLLIYGQEYDVWRDGKYLGVAMYLEDIIHGDGFFSDKDCVREVMVADCWKLRKN